MQDNYTSLIDNVYSQLEALGVETAKFVIDHIAYQASSSLDYQEKLEQALELGELISESIVGGRRVAIIKLHEPFSYRQQQIHVIEVVEPKQDQHVASAWEHVEFTTAMSLEGLVEKYPELAWDKGAMDRNEFPMLILKLESGIKAKFPKRGVLAELERQEQA